MQIHLETLKNVNSNKNLKKKKKKEKFEQILQLKDVLTIWKSLKLKVSTKRLFYTKAKNTSLKGSHILTIYKKGFLFKSCEIRN